MFTILSSLPSETGFFPKLDLREKRKHTYTSEEGSGSVA